MVICVLASGSRGNATYVSSGSTAVLIDAGLSCREVTRRLHSIGVDPLALDAVVLSHEHGDHTCGVGALSRRYGVGVYANEGTAMEASLALSAGELLAFTTGTLFNVGSLEITPFPVPHDGSDPVGFVVSDGSACVGIATDVGSVTPGVVEGLGGCEAVVLESNHDSDMLIEGPYPWPLKRRVMGPRGHLSNDDAAVLIEGIYHGDLKHLVLAHLSRTNNLPGLTLACAKKALGRRGSGVQLSLGLQDRVGELIRLR